MNQRQRNVFNMVKATVDLLMSNKAVWEDETPIANGVMKLVELCTDVEEEAAAQHQNETKGRTANRDAERAKLEAFMYIICGRMLLYANEMGEMQTARLVTVTRSQLSHLPLERLLIAARSVVARAMDIGEELDPYKVTQEDVDLLKEYVDTTAHLSAHRDAVKGEHTGNTLNLVMLFTKIRKLLKQMDKNVEVYLEDRSFIQAYFLTRRITDHKGGGGKKEEGAV